MSGGPAPFRDSDERDSSQWTADKVSDVAQLLPSLMRRPDFAPYRVAAAGAVTPMMPSVVDLACTERVLRQVVECLRDSYRQRVRYDDDPDPWRERDPNDLDDEVPF